MNILRLDRRDDGFSVIELCVGIFIGAIVLSMAVSVLFSTNSSGNSLLSKQEVTSNTRHALSRVLKDLGSAQSLLRCTVWKSGELQVEYETYLRRVENGGDDPATTVIENGSPTFSGSSADCLEYYETGHVLLRVLPNSVCWFKDLTPGLDDTIDYTQPFYAACLFRGAAGRDANYDSAGTDVGYSGASVVSMPCVPDTGQASQQDKLYYLECTYSDANMHYFVPNATTSGSWTFVDNSYREVLDFGELNTSSTHVRANIFTYTNSAGATPGYVNDVAGSNVSDLLYVNVNMNVLYDSPQKNDDGTNIQSIYRYSQTVLLQGAKTYSDEGAYADKFTG